MHALYMHAHACHAASPVPGLATMKRPKLIDSLFPIEDKTFAHNLVLRWKFFPVWEYYSRLATYGGNSTEPSAKELVSAPSPHYLKVESEVILAHFVRPEEQLKFYLAMSWYHPPKPDEPAGNKEKHMHAHANIHGPIKSVVHTFT